MKINKKDIEKMREYVRSRISEDQERNLMIPDIEIVDDLLFPTIFDSQGTDGIDFYICKKCANNRAMGNYDADTDQCLDCLLDTVKEIEL